MSTFETKLAMSLFCSCCYLPIFPCDEGILDCQTIKRQKFSELNLPANVSIKVTKRMSCWIILLISFIICIEIISVDHFFNLVPILFFLTFDSTIVKIWGESFSMIITEEVSLVAHCFLITFIFKIYIIYLNFEFNFNFFDD